MKLQYIKIMALVMALIAGTSVMADEGGKSVVVAPADLTWKDMGIPGVVSACVSGDMEKGASKFFLKYPVGFVTPAHHHSTDHSVTVVSGTITLTVDGKDHLLGPGSYFELNGKAVHVAKVEGNEDALFFIQADGPWDVVMEK
jgi:mannose-6-phosphate isomerase-like protein (cupin superfamily)